MSLKFSQVLKGSSPWRSELMMPSSGPRKVMTPWKDARSEVRSSATSRHNDLQREVNTTGDAEFGFSHLPPADW